MAKLFYLLFFFTPLVFFTRSSELFEFNKMIFVYLWTVLITCLWITKMIINKKIIFRRTILDIPLLIFWASQVISTLGSIDPHVSIFGYWGRFNGGLLSLASYSLLYWGFVSNINSHQAKNCIWWILGATGLSCLYGVLQHFGIDKDVWVQDVQTRVFSTFGQPNWLAAWIVGVLPFVWVMEHKYKWLGLTLSALFFSVLLFTQSRSGLLGIAVADILFWAITIFKNRNSKILSCFVLCHLIFVILYILIGSPLASTVAKTGGTVLEGGGTESGKIRQIVWKGAINIWKDHPIIGSGPETFAFSYYSFKPTEHNLTSEWDYLYNKAHNEYLGYLANTGLFGLIAYLSLVSVSLYLIAKQSNYSIAAGYIGILVSNFFGFSVVPTNLLLFLFPAISVCLNTKPANWRANPEYSLGFSQKLQIALVAGIAVIGIYLVGRYWFADYYYAQKNPSRAIALNKYEPPYHDELSKTYTRMAITYFESGQTAKATAIAKQAISESDSALALSPRNVPLLKNRYTMFLNLSEIEQRYLNNAKDAIFAAAKLAPTDARIHFSLGLAYARIGEIDNAINTLNYVLKIKPDYKEAKEALEIISNNLI